MPRLPLPVSDTQRFDAAVRIFVAMVPALELAKLSKESLSTVLQFAAGVEDDRMADSERKDKAARLGFQRLLVYAELAVRATTEIVNELHHLEPRG